MQVKRGSSQSSISKAQARITSPESSDASRLRNRAGTPSRIYISSATMFPDCKPWTKENPAKAHGCQVCEAVSTNRGRETILLCFKLPTAIRLVLACGRPEARMKLVIFPWMVLAKRTGQVLQTQVPRASERKRQDGRVELEAVAFILSPPSPLDFRFCSRSLLIADPVFACLFCFVLFGSFSPVTKAFEWMRPSRLLAADNVTKRVDIPRAFP